MNAVLYARVSSEQQAERDLSIPAQLKELEKYAQKHDYNVVDIFIDEAKSARSANRPEFQKMVSLSKQKNPPFEAILVWKLSRFARNREDSILYKSLLKKKGIQVISINEQIDDTPAGKMLEGMLEVIDEFYSNNLASDTMRGMKENAERGFYCGGNIPYGYKLKSVNINGNEKKIFEINAEEAPVVKKIYNLCLKGEGAKDIAKYLNENYPLNSCWNNTRILSILHNEIYTGTFIWNKKNNDPVKIENHHEAIIPREDFLKVQELINLRSPNITHPRSLSTRNLLNGLIYCSSCGKLYTSCSAKSGKFHYYICQSKLKAGNGICRQKILNIEKFDSYIISVIKERVLTDDNIKELIRLVNKEFSILEKEYRTKIENIQKAVSDLTRRRTKLYEAIELSELDVSDIAPRIKELNHKIEQLNDNKVELEIKLLEKDFLSEKEILPYLDDIRATLELGTIAERKSFIRSFIKKIWIDYPTATIEYTIPLNKNDKSKKEVLIFNRVGWGRRIRTSDDGTKTRCLTAWPFPNRR